SSFDLESERIIRILKSLMLLERNHRIWLLFCLALAIIFYLYKIATVAIFFILMQILSLISFHLILFYYRRKLANHEAEYIKFLKVDIN
ncbi:MAG: hypothetical protein O9301_15305, partial [Leptospira sp.]|nr:hypothetical protein [Leptospira sp.]